MSALSLSVRPLREEITLHGLQAYSGLSEGSLEDFVSRIVRLNTETETIQVLPNPQISSMVEWLSEKWNRAAPFRKESLMIRDAGEPSQNGGFKQCFFGVLATAEKVHHVVVLITLPQRINGFNPNHNEYSLLNIAIERPFPGTVPVFAVKQLDSTPENGVQFASVHPRFTTDFFSLIKSNVIKDLTREVKISIIFKILESVSNLHENLLHLDIKPENILLLITPPPKLVFLDPKDFRVLNDPETQLEVRLCDLATAIPVGGNSQNHIPNMTRLWAAPELIDFFERQKTDSNVFLPPSLQEDAWSVGLVALAIFDIGLFSQVACPCLLKSKILIGEHIKRYRDYYNQSHIPAFSSPSVGTDPLMPVLQSLLDPNPAKRSLVRDALKLILSQQGTPVARE